MARHLSLSLLLVSAAVALLGPPALGMELNARGASELQEKRHDPVAVAALDIQSLTVPALVNSAVSAAREVETLARRTTHDDAINFTKRTFKDSDVLERSLLRKSESVFGLGSKSTPPPPPPPLPRPLAAKKASFSLAAREAQHTALNLVSERSLFSKIKSVLGFGSKKPAPPPPPSPSPFLATNDNAIALAAREASFDHRSLLSKVKNIFGFGSKGSPPPPPPPPLLPATAANDSLFALAARDAKMDSNLLARAADPEPLLAIVCTRKRGGPVGARAVSWCDQANRH